MFISGSGPSLFAVANTRVQAQNILQAMQIAFKEVAGLASDGYISKINTQGAVCLT